MTDLRDVPIRLVYNECASQREKLVKLFGITDSRGPPKLVRYRIDEFGKLQNLEFYPNNISPEDEILIGFGIYDKTTGYDISNHLILVKYDDCDPHNLAEEVTHSVVRTPNGEVTLQPEDFKEFDRYYDGFGVAHQALAKIGIGSFTIYLGEFFPPLGQAYLLGNHNGDGNRPFWCEFLYRLNIAALGNLSVEGRDKIRTTLRHIPQTAGEILLDLYQGDVEALLREHPELPNLEGPELWERYCVPLLTSGKLD